MAPIDFILGNLAIISPFVLAIFYQINKENKSRTEYYRKIDKLEIYLKLVLCKLKIPHEDDSR